MIPQPDPHVAASNPHFALLYRDLEKNRLCENGASRVLDGKVSKERREFEEALHKLRVEEAKKEILRDAIGIVGYRGDELPDELQQVVQIVSAQLEGKIKDVDGEIASGEVSYFLEEITHSAPAISAHITQTASLLSAILNPSEPPSDLASALTDLRTHVSTSRASLSSSRTALATSTAALLSLYAQTFESAVRILEQVLHGRVARHTRARATYLCLVAEGIEKKLLILKAQVANQVYDPETRGLLKERMEEAEAESRRVGGVLRRREGWLGQMRAQGRGLEKVAEDVAAVKAEICRVRGEVERLESGRV